MNIIKVLAIVPLLLFFIVPLKANAFSGTINNRSIMMSNSSASAHNVSYAVSGQLDNNQVVGSMSIEFCSNSPLYYDTCVAPSGFNIQGATISNQVGITNFAVDIPNTTVNKIVLTRAPAAIIAPLQISFDLQGINNPSYTGTFYAKIITYPSIDATGLDSDFGGLALATTPNYTISTEVPPFLLFCVAVQIPGLDCNNAQGEYASLGNLSATSTASAMNQFLITTNAESGYNIFITGNTLTSGNNVINPLSALSASISGQSQFGLNLRANSNPAVGADPAGSGSGGPVSNYNIPNQFIYINNGLIATSPNVSSPLKYTASFITNVNSGQAPGVYTSTFTYSAFANF